MNGQVDLERRVTDWLRAEAPARASDRVLAATLDRVAVLGQERALPRWSVGDRSGSSRLVLIAATAALLALLVATAVLIGGPHDDRLPAPSTPVVPTTDPAPSFIPTAPPVPARIPTTTVHAGSAATDIGQVTWTALDGDLSNIPSSQIFETPDGFASIEPDLDGGHSRFWTSTDGLEWTVGTMPVPAEGVVGHSAAAGEHWIWSARDLRLWRSTDFVTWTELDLAAIRPPAINGIRWTIYPSNAVTIGSTTVIPWRLYGSLALEELLGVAPEPGTSLIVGSQRDSGNVGEVRPVSRFEATVNGPSQSGTRVGSIRITLDGDIVTITDAERDTVVAQIDARLFGVPAADLAKGLSEEGAIAMPAGGAVITDDTVTALVPPPDVTSIAPIDGRFIGLANDYHDGREVVWSSADGITWVSLGPPDLPYPSNSFYLLPRPDGADPGQPLTASAAVAEAGQERSELWSSTDGLHWESLGVTFGSTESGIQPIAAPGGGFVGTGNDYALHVSARGTRWTIVEGVTDLGQTMEESGGMSNSSTARDRVFIVEVRLTGERRLWVLQVAQLGG